MWVFFKTQNKTKKLTSTFLGGLTELVINKIFNELKSIVMATKADLSDVVWLLMPNEHFSMHNTSNHDADDLQQQKTMLGAALVS